LILSVYKLKDPFNFIPSFFDCPKEEERKGHPAVPSARGGQVIGCTFFWFVFFMQVKKMNISKKDGIYIAR
jgi:hypothetical protein